LEACSKKVQNPDRLTDFHPDQRNTGAIYTSFNAIGTKVDGLPVRLMESWETAMQQIENGKLFLASSMKSKNEDYNDGAILLARFSFEQLTKMGFGINIPFDSRKNKPYAELLPEEKENKLFLKIKTGEYLDKLDAGLRTRFDSSGFLLGSSGEFYIPEMLPTKEYLDCLLVFRPDDSGNCFHRKYWANDFFQKLKFGERK